jgi:hypothetical protein
MAHPLVALSKMPEKRVRVFVALLVATLVLTFLFRFIGPSRPTIVDFELAGSVPRAQAIIDAWSETDRIRAGFSLGIDYLYMPVYSTTIALACVLAASVLKGKAWRSIGVLLAWGLWVAALSDAIENMALFTELLGNNVAPWPSIAQICATIKFGLILAGLLYTIIGVCARLLRRSNPQPAAS